MITVSCAVCGSPFQVKPYRLTRTPVLCCGKHCAGIHKIAYTLGDTGKRDKTGTNNPNWKGGNQVVTCTTCQKPIPRKPFAVARTRYPFCDQRCWGIWAAQHRVGENHPSWDGGHPEYYGPNWLAQRKAARNRDGYICRHCGKTQKQNGRALDVHHIQPFKTFGYIADQNDHYLQANALANLISLCRSCHRYAEAGTMPPSP